MTIEETKKTILAIKRKQISLAPGLVCTAHGAQGQTKEAVITDLVLVRGVCSIASYVAVTCIKKREGLLDHRPFKLESFLQDIPQDTALLLPNLRRKKQNWSEIQENMIRNKPVRYVRHE